jgi:hypothetical protein
MLLAPWRPTPSPLCVARGADGSLPAWRSTELASRWRAGAAGEISQGDTGEVRGGAGGWARVKSGFVFPILTYLLRRVFSYEFSVAISHPIVHNASLAIA